MKALRIIISPIVFLISMGAMIIFPGVICFLLGASVIIGKFLQGKTNEVGKKDWFMTFLIITFPILNTLRFIKDGTFIE